MKKEPEEKVLERKSPAMCEEMCAVENQLRERQKAVEKKLNVKAEVKKDLREDIKTVLKNSQQKFE